MRVCECVCACVCVCVCNHSAIIIVLSVSWYAVFTLLKSKIDHIYSFSDLVSKSENWMVNPTHLELCEI